MPNQLKKCVKVSMSSKHSKPTELTAQIVNPYQLSTSVDGLLFVSLRFSVIFEGDFGNFGTDVGKPESAYRHPKHSNTEIGLRLVPSRRRHNPSGAKGT